MKLIRDNTPGLIDQPGVTRFTRDEDEYKALLRMKVMEEAAEVATSTSREEMIMEFGDLHEVILALYQAYGISREDVNFAASQKRKIKGGFDNGLILLYDPSENK
jgi:predicted house-cleaning noncanonical NTP pyrophosphatase (MazG superfamily)